MRSSQSFKYSTLHAIEVSHTIGTCHTIGICHSIGLLSYDWIKSCDTRAVLHDLILSELFHIFADPNRHFPVWADVINIWKWTHKTFKSFITIYERFDFLESSQVYDFVVLVFRPACSHKTVIRTSVCLKIKIKIKQNLFGFFYN